MRDKILYIGEFPPPYGGVTVKNELLVNEVFGGHDIELFDLYTFKRNRFGAPLAAFKLLCAIRRADKVCVGVGHPFRTCMVFRMAKVLRGKGFLGNITVFMMGMGTPGYLRAHPGYIADVSKGCCIFAESETLVHELEELGCTARYLPNFRKGDRACEPRPVGDRVHFVYFAQVRAEKGFDTLAEAVRTLNAAGLQDKFDVAVYGNVIESYRKQFERLLAATPNMEYKGIFDASSGDVCAELNQYDSSSSSSWREGMSGTNIECKFAGVANIVSDAGFNPECVHDGKDGLLVKPRSVESLVEAMRSVIADHGLLERLKRNSYEDRINYDVVTWKLEVLNVVYGQRAIRHGI